MISNLEFCTQAYSQLNMRVQCQHFHTHGLNFTSIRKLSQEVTGRCDPATLETPIFTQYVQRVERCELRLRFTDHSHLVSEV